MRDSKIVEISEDQLRFRPWNTPLSWPIIGPQLNISTNLNVDVPEFVPGQAYQPPSFKGNLVAL
jgi:la-related protein 1